MSWSTWKRSAFPCSFSFFFSSQRINLSFSFSFLPAPGPCHPFLKGVLKSVAWLFLLMQPASSSGLLGTLATQASSICCHGNNCQEEQGDVAENQQSGPRRVEYSGILYQTEGLKPLPRILWFHVRCLRVTRNACSLGRFRGDYSMVQLLRITVWRRLRKRGPERPRVDARSAVSNSVWPHGLWPARLLCPWGSPGKDPGGGCHFLLQGIFPT